jgi:tetratricopeptide (TPR) repeat protein
VVRLIRTVAAVCCCLALAFSPVYGEAQTDQRPCFDPKAPADERVASCSELLLSGSLSDKSTVIAYYNRGIAYQAKGREDLAIADYTAALRIDPNYADAYYNRGNVYQAKGQEDLAIADYTAAQRANPKDPDAHYNRGIAYHAKGQEDLAIADYTAVLRINSNYANAYYNRGISYHAKGQEDLAIADYTVALRIIPNSAQAYKDRGYALFDKGRFSDAAVDFERAVELRASDGYAVLWLHIARRRYGDADPGFAKRSAALDAAWPAPIVALYLGRQPPEPPALSDRQKCQGVFFAAEAQLLDREIAHARSLFARAVSTCPRAEVDYIDATRAELTRLPK